MRKYSQNTKIQKTGNKTENRHLKAYINQTTECLPINSVQYDLQVLLNSILRIQGRSRGNCRTNLISTSSFIFCKPQNISLLVHFFCSLLNFNSIKDIYSFMFILLCVSYASIYLVYLCRGLFFAFFPAFCVFTKLSCRWFRKKCLQCTYFWVYFNHNILMFMFYLMYINRLCCMCSAPIQPNPGQNIVPLSFLFFVFWLFSPCMSFFLCFLCIYLMYDIFAII